MDNQKPNFADILSKSLNNSISNNQGIVNINVHHIYQENKDLKDLIRAIEKSQLRMEEIVKNQAEQVEALQQMVAQLIKGVKRRQISVQMEKVNGDETEVGSESEDNQQGQA
ncbi:hypothetical protein FGO68_gene11679 [Halteria grandinella]|uniref:Uncharacterized protein n=1 Tax=Halteria grandinella TaxID=5974 RepID=A0A8J8P0Z0_HALGN|nr:hypothetical protein FGO68_gene11679 [Halteria grandinella]